MNMRERIKFQRQNGLNDSLGGKTETSLTDVTVELFAAVELQRPERIFDSMGILREKQLYKVKCNALDTEDVQATDLILWNGRLLAINTIRKVRLQDFYREFICTDYN